MKTFLLLAGFTLLSSSAFAEGFHCVITYDADNQFSNATTVIDSKVDLHDGESKVVGALGQQRVISLAVKNGFARIRLAIYQKEGTGKGEVYLDTGVKEQLSGQFELPGTPSQKPRAKKVKPFGQLVNYACGTEVAAPTKAQP